MTKTDRHLVVDGSNIATEGRTSPSLAQLDEAVRAISGEYPYESLTVVVDATFAHRIDASERDEFEAAVLAGEIVTPPAGAVGRGDAFILQVADKVGAVVFSNDSFQEFHGEHEWLFDEGRLIGGKPIEGVGWIFVERVPVRGPASRRAVREANKRGKGSSRSSGGRRRKGSSKALGSPPVPSPSTPPPTASSPAKKSTAKKSTAKKSAAKESAPAPSDGSKSSSRSKSPKSIEELNDARSFMTFVSQYSIGDDVPAEVERFSSHGCYVRAATARCYLPSSAMGDPAPSKARDVVSIGQSVIVKVESLDADRRGINVALVRTITEDGEPSPSNGATKNRRTKPGTSPQVQDVAADDPAREGIPTRSSTDVATSKTTARKRATSTAKKTAATATSSARVKRATAKKTNADGARTAAGTAKKAPAEKAPAKKAAGTAKKTTAKKAAGTAKKTTAKKAAGTAKKTAGTAKKATTKKTTAKKAAGTAKKATAKKTTTKKTTAKKATTKKATAKKAAGTAKKATAKKATTKKAAAKKATAKKTTAKKTTTKKATKKATAKKTS